MASIPTSERREGELAGPVTVKCIVTINRREGVATMTISEIDRPRVPDGDYTLAVEGEPKSHWRRDRDGWSHLR